MNAKDYNDMLQDMLNNYCLFLVKIIYVENVSRWCNENGYMERDKDMPLKLVADEKNGCKLVVREILPDALVDKRINGLRMRGALMNVANNKADMLNSDKKRLAYIFLNEYSNTMPDLAQDEFDADSWVFSEMEKHGLFKE